MPRPAVARGAGAGPRRRDLARVMARAVTSASWFLVFRVYVARTLWLNERRPAIASHNSANVVEARPAYCYAATRGAATRSRPTTLYLLSNFRLCDPPPHVRQRSIKSTSPLMRRRTHPDSVSRSAAVSEPTVRVAHFPVSSSMVASPIVASLPRRGHPGARGAADTASSTHTGPRRSRIRRPGRRTGCLSHRTRRRRAAPPPAQSLLIGPPTRGGATSYPNVHRSSSLTSELPQVCTVQSCTTSCQPHTPSHGVAVGHPPASV